ncbi:hypothetical protein AALP_AA3G063200 [Arabis alpina]|uniref:Methyltransferase n=1 Tax=Arabis alpina TaxID=50452 RepID=A0A087H7E5_ARAAL|nr:hypothetical protein AALP_AA3G063200 [Arabis alpina]
MSKSGANIGGKTDVLAAVEKNEKYHGGEAEESKENSTDMANKYYDIATRLYEYQWGESFHYAHRWKGESLRESIKRDEHFLAMQLALKPGYKVLDVGCGIGGPMREIARFCNVSVTGLTNNEYQITRGKKENQLTGLDQTCNFVKADFMNMPFPDNSFDAVYAIAATCYAPDLYECYKEIYRVLKPGKHFAFHEWCLTDAFNPNNDEHKKIKKEIETDYALPELRPATKCLEAMKQAGFEVICDKNLAKDSPVPWYLPVDASQFSLFSLRVSPVGRFLTHILIKVLECVRIFPEGTHRIQTMLEKATSELVNAGKKEIFTPIYFVLAQKPE